MTDARDTNVSDDGWNVVQGCTKISDGCKHCFVAHQMGAEFNSVTTHPELLTLPVEAKSPRYFFVSDKGDLMHAAVPDEFIEQVIQVMRENPQHQYRVCTKRPERLASFDWPRYVAVGVSAENQQTFDERAPWLQGINTYAPFVSMQPMLGPIDITAQPYIRHIVVGGEYGASARPLELDWVRRVRDDCRTNSIGFTFQQVQEANGARTMGPTLDGKRHLANINYYEGL